MNRMRYFSVIISVSENCEFLCSIERDDLTVKLFHDTFIVKRNDTKVKEQVSKYILISPIKSFAHLLKAIILSCRSTIVSR